MGALHLSRRQLLAASVSGAVAAVPGCSGEIGSDDEPDDSVDNVSEGGDPEDRIPGSATLDFEYRTLRSETPEPFVMETDDDDDDDRFGRTSGILLVSDEDLEALHFERTPEGTDDVRDFLAETDFDSASIGIDQDSVGDCYVQHVEYVDADSRRFRTQSCDVLKEPTVECEADREVMQATFIRFPVAYDPEEKPTGRGGGWGSRCQYNPPDRDEEIGTNRTDEGSA